jgi:Uma2 family endonuclease
MWLCCARISSPEPTTTITSKGLPSWRSKWSPSNTAAELHEKIEQYLAAGGKAVWIVYPKSGQVIVHRADGSITKYGRGASIPAPEIHPDCASPVAELLNI